MPELSWSSWSRTKSSSVSAYCGHGGLQLLLKEGGSYLRECLSLQPEEACPAHGDPGDLLGFLLSGASGKSPASSPTPRHTLAQCSRTEEAGSGSLQIRASKLCCHLCCHRAATPTTYESL